MIYLRSPLSTKGQRRPDPFSFRKDLLDAVKVLLNGTWFAPSFLRPSLVFSTYSCSNDKLISQ